MAFPSHLEPDPGLLQPVPEPWQASTCEMTLPCAAEELFHPCESFLLTQQEDRRGG